MPRCRVSIHENLERILWLRKRRRRRRPRRRRPRSRRRSEFWPGWSAQLRPGSQLRVRFGEWRALGSAFLIPKTAIRSPDGANGSRECAPDDRLRAIRDDSQRRKRAPGLHFRSTRATRLRPLSLQQLHRVGGLLPELIEAALPRRLVGPPAQDGGAVAEAFAAEMIVANLDHEFWLQRTPLRRSLRRPSARPARRVAGEA